MDSDIFYPSSIGGWTRYMLTSSHLLSKVLVLCRVVHRYRHGVYRSIWAILWASRTMFKPYPYPSDSCVRNNRYSVGTRNLTAYRVIGIQPTAWSLKGYWELQRAWRVWESFNILFTTWKLSDKQTHDLHCKIPMSNNY